MTPPRVPLTIAPGEGDPSQFLSSRYESLKAAARVMLALGDDHHMSEAMELRIVRESVLRRLRREACAVKNREAAVHKLP